MSILIKGITIPTYDYIDIRIFPHGKAEINKIRTATRTDGTPAFYKTFDVVELPPHGRLIDADELMKDGWVLQKMEAKPTYIATQTMPLNNPSIPTIIEAEGEEDGSN